MSARPLLVRPKEAAAMIAVSTRQFYEMAKTVEAIRDACIELPNLRGIRVRVDALERAIERLGGVV